MNNVVQGYRFECQNSMFFELDLKHNFGGKIDWWLKTSEVGLVLVEDFASFFKKKKMGRSVEYTFPSPHNLFPIYSFQIIVTT